MTGAGTSVQAASAFKDEIYFIFKKYPEPAHSISPAQPVNKRYGGVSQTYETRNIIGCPRTQAAFHQV